MPIFKNHRGQFHKMNTALVALTSLYVIGAAVALSSPYWASSYPVLAPLVAFAATPLGIGVLIAVSAALIGLAVYAISKNNEISEEKAPKITRGGLSVRKNVYEEMKKNNQVKDDNGNVKPDQYYIDFSLDKKDYRVIINDQSILGEIGDTLLFDFVSLTAKDSNGKYTLNSLSEVRQKLSGQGDTWVNTYLGRLSSVTQTAPQQTK